MRTEANGKKKVAEMAISYVFRRGGRKRFSHELKPCESNFLPRREANRIEIGICERVFEIRFLLRKPKLKDLDLD